MKWIEMALALLDARPSSQADKAVEFRIHCPAGKTLPWVKLTPTLHRPEPQIQQNPPHCVSATPKHSKASIYASPMHDLFHIFQVRNIDRPSACKGNPRRASAATGTLPQCSKGMRRKVANPDLAFEGKKQVLTLTNRPGLCKCAFQQINLLRMQNPCRIE